MVSVTVEVVSVFEVIEPCVKLGTTGTAIAVLALARTVTPTIRTRYFFISHLSTKSVSVNSFTNWPTATVPAPPPVTVIAPAVVIVPARLPAVPDAVET